jgi:hypothetical protein
LIFVIVDGGDVVELFVLLFTDTWCRLINVLNASMDVLNEIGDWDWECCVCDDDEL